MQTPTILLIEDEASTADTISAALKAANFDTQWVSDPVKGCQAAGRCHFDLIVLDRMMPGLDGITLVERLRQAGIDTPILMLSALARSENRITGLDAGADDYLGKPFEADELVARARALIRRAHNKMHSAVLLYGELELHVKSRTAHRSGKFIALSPKEFDILKLLMEHAGDVVTREMLLQQVWHLTFDPQTNVIDVNMSRLRHRLEEGFGTAVLETVRGLGFRLIGSAGGGA